MDEEARCEATCITVGRVEKVRRCVLPATPHELHEAHRDNGALITWTEPKTHVGVDSLIAAAFYEPPTIEDDPAAKLLGLTKDV